MDIGIEKFDGSDFSFWMMQIEDYLYSRKLHLPLGEKPEGMKDEDWKLLDRQVLGVVRLTLSKNIAYNMAKETTTTGLIKTLSDMYIGGGKNNQSNNSKGKGTWNESYSKGHKKSDSRELKQDEKDNDNNSEANMVGLKKRGQGLRSWIRVDSSGNSEVIEVDKFTMMRRCDLPARDLRVLDTFYLYPSTILGREKAIVVNLEQIRCIITADEVLLLNSLDSYVVQYVVELQRRLKTTGGDDGTDLVRRRGRRNFDNVFGSTSHDYMPFEFMALEVALETACTFLNSQAAELEIEAYPSLDELTSKISKLNLERVRRLKSRLVSLTHRVQKVRDEIEQLMDDDGDMAEMYLTKKKMRMDSFIYGDQSISAPVSPVCSPPEARRLEKTLSIARTRSRHESMTSSESATESILELEMLLEGYFVVIDNTLIKLKSLTEYIDDTEDFINIQLDNVRNQLIRFELLLTTATFVITILGLVVGIFGMNFEVPLFQDPQAFKWVLVITGVCGITIFLAFVWFLRQKRLMPL